MTSRLRADGRGIRSLYFPFSFILADQINRASPESKGSPETGGRKNLIVCETHVGFTLPSAGVTPAPSEGNREMSRRRLSSYLCACRLSSLCHSERSEESRIF